MTKHNRQDTQGTTTQDAHQIDAHELIWGPILNDTAASPVNKQKQQSTCPPGRAYERFWELQESF